MDNKKIEFNEQKGTKMMQQYFEKKKEYPDCILMYRLGDFYEMFFDDAVKVSKLLGLTLTGRNNGSEGKAPMCGIPFHTSETYITKLVNLGLKVAICEQLSIPEKGKKLVDRDVVQVITAGTITNTDALESKKNNYVCSVFLDKDEKIGLCWVDITTGEMFAKQIEQENNFLKLNDALMFIKPSEVICNEKMKYSNQILSACELGVAPSFQMFYDWAFAYSKAEKTVAKQLNIISIDKLDIFKMPSAVCASGALIEYIMQTQKKILSIINKINIEKDSNYMYLDSITRRNLELVETMKDRKVKGSLLWVLDNTETAMGGRTLRKWVEQPLNNIDKINERLNVIDSFNKDNIKRASLKELLSQISDLERLFGKVSNGSVNPKDCIAIKNSLAIIPQIKKIINSFDTQTILHINNNLFDFTEVFNLLDNAFDENQQDGVPSHIRDGGFIRSGFNAKLDEYRNIRTNARDWMAQLEAKEREETKIKNLKISYNSVFGYFVDIPKSQIEYVPLRYVRKQTLANNERYTFDELKELEIQVLNSEENAIMLEQKLFSDIREFLLQHLQRIMTSAKQIGYLDAFLSLSECAVNNKYCKPTMECNEKIVIENGRHPIIEKINSEQTFIANDTNLDNMDNKIMIITGPNMAGKSTYLRQVAMIVLMAHIGSFIPARSACIGITDRIFTRIGASDDLSQGQSTFMLEMLEVSNILANATKKSLVVLDEVGRGTSTHDGLSIAWSLMEYLSKNDLGRILFSTHYHELTELEGKLEGVKNYQIAVKESENSILFLRKIMRGGAAKSFGIEVGAMAGLPNDVITRAKSILGALENNNDNKNPSISVMQNQNNENNAKCECEICKEISKIQVDIISPLEAFSILCDLKKLELGGTKNGKN